MRKSTVPKIHPTSLELCKKNHPWITKDEFSVEFDESSILLEIDELDDELFLHDPTHPSIKARRWGKSEMLFVMDLEDRIANAILERVNIKDRENIYLCFGEADSLPGLFIQKLNQVILIQYQAYFWEDLLEMVIDFLKRRYPRIENIFTQKRIAGAKKEHPKVVLGEEVSDIVIEEFGLQYEIRLQAQHDIGIYTDMSSIRKKINPLFEKSKTVLNLFSYTGAFSLQGLKNKCQVTSVDLSGKYMSWLEKNIKLNELPSSDHQSVVKPVNKFLASNQDKFDLIISDPPSFSTDGKKSQSALDFYKKSWGDFAKALSKNGKLVVFLNTHKINRTKFRRVIPRNWKVERELYMSKDCPLLQGFPEGDYLKGFVLTHG